MVEWCETSFYYCRGDSTEREKRSSKTSRRRSRSRSNEKPKNDDSGLSFDPTNLDKVC